MDSSLAARSELFSPVFFEFPMGTSCSRRLRWGSALPGVRLSTSFRGDPPENQQYLITARNLRRGSRSAYRTSINYRPVALLGEPAVPTGYPQS